MSSSDASKWFNLKHRSSRSHFSGIFRCLKNTYLRQVCTEEGKRHSDFTRSGKVNSVREDQTGPCCVTINHMLFALSSVSGTLAFLSWSLTMHIVFPFMSLK